jgi:hypothetical protein
MCVSGGGGHSSRIDAGALAPVLDRVESSNSLDSLTSGPSVTLALVEYSVVELQHFALRVVSESRRNLLSTRSPSEPRRHLNPQPCSETMSTVSTVST